MARPFPGQPPGKSYRLRGLAGTPQVPDIWGLSIGVRWSFARPPQPETTMSDTDLFFSRTGMDRSRVQNQLDSALSGADDGELFLEYSQSESFAFDDNRLKAASFDTSQGFGLRAVAGEATGYHELIQHLEGKISLDDAIEQIKIGTRQLARRQMKWFRRFSNVTWLKGDRPMQELADEMQSKISQSDP